MYFGAFGEFALVGEPSRTRGSCLRKWICAKAAKRVVGRFLRGPARSSSVDGLVCACGAAGLSGIRPAGLSHVRSFFLHSQKHVV